MVKSLIWKLQIWSLIILFFIISKDSFGQLENYYPYYFKDTMPNFLLAKERREAIINMKLEGNYSNSVLKEFEKEKKEVADHKFYFIRYYGMIDSIVEPYVREVFNKVKVGFSRANDCNIIILVNPSAGAYSFGDGSIYIQTGLFRILENEDQLAYILSHELSHIELDHTIKRLKSRINNPDLADRREEFKKAIKEKYNKYEKVYKVRLKAAIDYTYHSRLTEYETDSLAYVKFVKTKYDVTQAPIALLNIEKEFDHYNSILNFNSFFGCNLNNYTFKDKPSPVQSIFEVELSDNIFNSTDSLVTHPDCKKRAERIKNIKLVSDTSNNFKPDASRFERVKFHSLLEGVEVYFLNELYDLTLFETLSLLEKYPQNNYLQSIVILTLHQLKRYKKKHELSQVVFSLHKDNPNGYNHLLETITDLRLNDYTLFANCFKEKMVESKIDNEYTLAVKYALAMLNEDKANASKYQEEFENKYSDSRLEFIFEKSEAKGKKKKKS